MFLVLFAGVGLFFICCFLFGGLVREDCLGRVLGWLGLLFNVDPSRISEGRVLGFREVWRRVYSCWVCYFS